MKSKGRIINSNVPFRAHLKKLRGGEVTQLQNACLLQKELLRARDYTTAILDAVPPLLVLDQKLRVQTANKSFCKSFKMSLPRTLNRSLFELGGGRWNIPSLRALLEQVLPKKRAFKDYEVTLNIKGIGTRTILLAGRQLDNIQRILLVIEDITQRRNAEARIRRVFEAAPDGMLILDSITRRITDANPFMSALLGYSRKQLLGKALWEIGLLKDEKAGHMAFRELKRKHFVRYEELPLQSKSGQRHVVEFVGNLYQENGRQAIQCNIRDITERKRADARLRQSEDRYRTLFNSIDEGFCVIELLFDDANQPVDYWFLEVNPAFQRQTGIRRPVGKRIREIVPDIEDHWIETYGNVALTGNAIRFENEAKRLKRWFDVYAFRLGGTGSRKVAILFTNITENRRTEQALLEAKNNMGRHALELERVVAERTGELQRTVAELQAFSYSISHDMRAPLRSMEGYAQFLLNDYADRLDEKGVNYLHQITRSAIRLDRLIRDVLSYSRVLHSDLPIESVDLDRLVRDIVETFPNGRPTPAAIQIKGTLPAVRGNEALLGQCVSNLLSNGAKFVSPGTMPHVEISAEASDDDFIRLNFRDNGIGIAPENHGRIFRMFERIHPETAYEGTGIGLTIVRKAAERMDAQLGFDSQLGQGSNFWIQIRKG